MLVVRCKVCENYSSRDGSISFQLDTTRLPWSWKMVLLPVLMLEITHILPVLKPEAPFSQEYSTCLIKEYTEIHQIFLLTKSILKKLQIITIDLAMDFRPGS